MPMGAAEDWKRLAERVVSRREQLDMRTRQDLSRSTGLSYRVLGDLERGTRGVSEGTLALVEQALEWAPGSARKVLRGGEPAVTAVPAPAVSRGIDIADRDNGRTAPIMRPLAEAYRIAAKFSGAEFGYEGRRLFEVLDEIRQLLDQNSMRDGSQASRPNSTESELNRKESLPTVLRIAIGRYLKRQREDNGLDCETVCDFLGYTDDEYLRQLESGHAAFGPQTLHKLLLLYRVPGAIAERDLAGLAMAAGRSGWWTRYDDILPDWFKQYVQLEQCAATIRTFESHFVPGLLQTADYARAVLGLSQVDSVGSRVQMRLQRQLILHTATPPKLWAIIDEGALRHPQEPVAMMRDQIRHLLFMSGKRGVTIQILPRNAPTSTNVGSFSLLRFGFEKKNDPDIVYLEQLTTALYLDRPEEVSAYRNLMNRLSVAALSPRESETFLTDLYDRYRRESDELV